MDHTEDYRPNGQYPPPREVKKYWCSGQGPSYFTMCAVVDAPTEQIAKEKIKKSWPNLQDWRFCEEKPLDFRPGDRFPWPEYDR